MEEMANTKAQVQHKDDMEHIPFLSCDDAMANDEVKNKGESKDGRHNFYRLEILRRLILQLFLRTLLLPKFVVIKLLIQFKLDELFEFIPNVCWLS